MTKPIPHLSVVIASQNDDHDGSMLHRAWMHVRALVAQCQPLGLFSELNLVRWNPQPRAGSEGCPARLAGVVPGAGVRPR